MSWNGPPTVWINGQANEAENTDRVSKCRRGQTACVVYWCELACLRLVDYWLGEWVSSAVVNNLSLLCGENHNVKSNCEFSLCLKFGLHRYSFSSRTKKKSMLKQVKKRKSKSLYCGERLRRFKPPYDSLQGESRSRKKIFFFLW